MPEHRYKGFTADQYFSDPALARLARAGCEGDGVEVSKLIKQGVNVNGTGTNLMTPLIWTVHCENLSGVAALLAAGANPNQRDFQGYTPFVIQLHDYDNDQILKLLIRHGADLYYAPDGSFPFAITISSGVNYDKWNNYYTLLGSGIDLNHVYDIDNTVAFYAANDGQFDKVIELIDRGYNRYLGELAIILHIHSTNPNAAVYGDKLRLIQILKDRGVPFDSIVLEYDAGNHKFDRRQY